MKLGLAWFAGVSAQLRVISPEELKTALKADVIPVSTSTFGSPFYGESLTGELISVKGTGCSAEAYSAVASEEAAGHVKRFYLLSRGDCSFLKKVRAAQDANADAAVIVDYANSTWTRAEIQEVVLSSGTDDATAELIHIPSVLVDKSDGAILQQFATESSTPIISLEWDIPQRQIVRVDYWYTPGHLQSLKTVATLAPALLRLLTIVDFRSHIYLISLPQDQAHYCYQNNTDLCALPSPNGMTSAEVLEESLRELCIRRTTSKALKRSDGVSVVSSADYLKYMGKVPNCMEPEFDRECPSALMKTLGIDESAVGTCMSESGADLLEFQRETSAWGVTATRINGARFSGQADPMDILKAACLAVEGNSGDCASIIRAEATMASSLTDSVIVVGIVSVIFMTAFMYLYSAYQSHKMKKSLENEMKEHLENYYRVEDMAGSHATTTGIGSNTLLQELEFANLKFR